LEVGSSKGFEEWTEPETDKVVLNAMRKSATEE
jgi:hypothetical protein